MCVCVCAQGVELGPRPDVSRGPPLDRWADLLDPEGRVENPERVKELVFRGVSLRSMAAAGLGARRFAACLLLQGVAAPLRKELWKFLLGFYPWNSTAKEREDILRLQTCVLTPTYPTTAAFTCMNLSPAWQLCVCVCVDRDEYFRMKVQWKSVSEEQEMRNSLLRGYRNLIGQLHRLSLFSLKTTTTS